MNSDAGFFFAGVVDDVVGFAGLVDGGSKEVAVVPFAFDVFTTRVGRLIKPGEGFQSTVPSLRRRRASRSLLPFLLRW